MRRLVTPLLVAWFLVTSLGAAQGPTSSKSEASKAKTLRTYRARPYQVGTASWYGSYFQGKTTASGEPYDMYGFTAAHPYLPLGTWVRVTNLSNGRRVIVRVNDRGPVVPGRIIDLSYEAAGSLRFRGKGIQQVRLDIIQPETLARLNMAE